MIEEWFGERGGKTYFIDWIRLPPSPKAMFNGGESF